MSFFAAILLALAFLILWLRNRIVASTDNDTSDFDPAYDKHVRDLLDDP